MSCFSNQSSQKSIETSRPVCSSAAYLLCKKMDGFTFQTPILVIILKEMYQLKEILISENGTPAYLHFYYNIWPLGSFEELVLNDVSTFYVNVTLMTFVVLWSPKNRVEKNQATSFSTKEKNGRDF